MKGSLGLACFTFILILRKIVSAETCDTVSEMNMRFVSVKFSRKRETSYATSFFKLKFPTEGKYNPLSNISFSKFDGEAFATSKSLTPCVISKSLHNHRRTGACHLTKALPLDIDACDNLLLEIWTKSWIEI